MSEVGGEPTALGRAQRPLQVATDDSRDVQVTDTWYLAGTDLVVRRVVNNSTTNGSPVGDVHYLEHVELTLGSLTPAR